MPRLSPMALGLALAAALSTTAPAQTRTDRPGATPNPGDNAPSSDTPSSVFQTPPAQAGKPRPPSSAMPSSSMPATQMPSSRLPGAPAPTAPAPAPANPTGPDAGKGAVPTPADTTTPPRP